MIYIKESPHTCQYKRKTKKNQEFCVYIGRKLLGRETPDGDFGLATEKAVKSFQTEKGLEPDGEIGTDTWTTLLTLKI
ncbi:MAG: peptidoglycan-binding protein [Anaerolineaceae bacterium]|nr:peptidoglycan-binding protein [Anaerolineaceae bacterium]